MCINDVCDQRKIIEFAIENINITVLILYHVDYNLFVYYQTTSKIQCKFQGFNFSNFGFREIIFLKIIVINIS